MTYKVKFLKSVTVAEKTAAFYFEKPAGFMFKAGQTGDFTLIGPLETDSRGDTRTFSLAGAPSDNFLQIATRLRGSAYKRVLKAYNPGTEVNLDAPHGSFTLHENKVRAAVFLAGGIGVTPFHSMILEDWRWQNGRKLYLFHSNRHLKDAPFYDEFSKLAEENPNFIFVPTLTKPDKSDEPWSGEVGYIDIPMLKKYLAGLHNPIYYVAGPPEMVMATRKMLEEGGISPDDIRSEEFDGYN